MNLAEGYVVGIKENTTYEVKDIVKIKHNLTEKRVFCIGLRLPETRLMNAIGFQVALKMLV